MKDTYFFLASSEKLQGIAVRSETKERLKALEKNVKSLQESLVRK